MNFVALHTFGIVTLKSGLEIVVVGKHKFLMTGRLSVYHFVYEHVSEQCALLKSSQPLFLVSYQMFVV